MVSRAQNRKIDYLIILKLIVWLSEPDHETKRILKPYQDQAYVWLCKMEGFPVKGELLADRVGLGTSIITLSLTAINADETEKIEKIEIIDEGQVITSYNIKAQSAPALLEKVVPNLEPQVGQTTKISTKSVQDR